MEIVFRSRQEVVVEILGSRRSSRLLLLHYSDETLGYLVDLVLREQVGHLAGTQHVVEELEKSFVLDLVVGEYERDSFAFLAGDAIDQLEVVGQIGRIVRST